MPLSTNIYPLFDPYLSDIIKLFKFPNVLLYLTYLISLHNCFVNEFISWLFKLNLGIHMLQIKVIIPIVITSSTKVTLHLFSYLQFLVIIYSY